MPSIGEVFRWIGALLAAVIAYALVFGAGSQVWKYVGGDPRNVMFWSAVFAAMFAILVAGHVVPRPQWRIAVWVVLLLIVVPLVGITVMLDLSRGWIIQNITVLIGTLLGGVVAVAQMRWSLEPVTRSP